MICLIALVMFSILGIFSARYRIIAKEALDCVFRRVTLRKCESGLDKRLKAQITGNLMRKSPKIGAFTYKHFEWISWFFTILMIWSIVQSGISGYNYAVYGNCNGKASDEFCIFDPLGTGAKGHNETLSCSVVAANNKNKLLFKPEIGASPNIGNKDSKVVIIEFGCYSCQYSKQAEATMEKLRENYPNHLFVFKHFPILSHNYSYEAAIAAECARNQGRFWEYHEKLFSAETLNKELFFSIAGETGLDNETFNKCYTGKETKSLVDADIESGKRSGLYGTPTVFVNDDYLIGPKDYSSYKQLISKND